MNTENYQKEKRLGNPMDYTPPSQEHNEEERTLINNKKQKKMTSHNANNDNNSSQTLREGDSGLGVPRVNLAPERTLSAEESKAHQEQEEARTRKEAEELLQNMAQERGAFLLPKVVQRFFFITLLLIASVLCLMIITDTVQFFANVQNFSTPMQWGSIALFIFFACIILYIIFILLRTILHLKKSPRVNLKALKTLAERQHLQKIAQEKQADARHILEKYLQDYPLTAQQETKFKHFGMNKEAWTSLEKGHQALMEKSTPMSHEDWCISFQNNFQSILDQTAKERVKSYAKRCALGTALMPFSLFDRLIVLYSCLSMIKDLICLYHLKPSMGQSMVIFSKVIITIYLSGIIEENAEFAAESFSETLRNNLPEGTLESLTGTLGTAVNATAAEAALNYFFINRLGKKTIRLLQPSIQD